MKKLIATGSKKNKDKARKRLEGAVLSLNLPGIANGEKSAAEALAIGFELLSESKPLQALQVADLLLAQIDDIVDVYLLRARALLDLESVGELVALVDDLLQAAPANKGVLMVAARYYFLIGESRRSLAAARKAAEDDPHNVEALLQMELCYRYSGDTERAAKILERCLQVSSKKRWALAERFKQYTSALFRLANYAQLSGDRLADLEKIHETSEDAILRTQSAYALASQANLNQDRAAEVSYLLRAKLSESQMLGVDQAMAGLQNSYDKHIQKQIALFDTVVPAWMPQTKANHAPVFILGLPRSGTTLMEQILGGHSRVGQVGESKGFLNALTRQCMRANPIWMREDYPDGLEKLTPEAFDQIVEEYERHQSVLTDKDIYIDKELANFKYVGLFASLFPKAKFIHMDRAPLDIFLSCFRNSIPGVPEAADLQAIAQYYIYLKRLVGYWHKLLGDRMLIVNYQELVAEPEPFARQAAEFMGLEYEPEMLDFHLRKNIVRTLSVDQVRKKIYTSSIEKWKEYADLLEPARKVLESHSIPLQGVAYL